MKRALIAFLALTLVMTGCSRKNKQPASLQATATGSAIVESSGGKQIGYVGMPLDQPIIVQVNDAAGSGGVFQRAFRCQLYSSLGVD